MILNAQNAGQLLRDFRRAFGAIGNGRSRKQRKRDAELLRLRAKKGTTKVMEEERRAFSAAMHTLSDVMQPLDAGTVEVLARPVAGTTYFLDIFEHTPSLLANLPTQAEEISEQCARDKLTRGPVG